jgi:hypothetical protein
MNKISDIKGKKFGKLTVLSLLGQNKYGKGIWLCRCKCGNKTKSITGNLNNGNTQSCGCFRTEQIIKSATKHKKCYTKFYKCWCNIKQRCTNSNFTNYKYWGGRGITYDPNWENFINFYNDMYFKYIYAKRKYKNSAHPLSIERIDNNGNYYFDNCIFIPKCDQSKNRRNNKWI